MRVLGLPSRYQILVAILVILIVQLILWMVVMFRPRSHITIYLDRLDVEQNRLDFQNAVLIPNKVESHRKARNNRTRGSLNRKHRKSGILARLDAINREKMAQWDREAHEHNVTRKERNETNPSLLERQALLALPWSEETRQRFTENLEPSLFTEELAPISDSSCDIVEIQAPERLCRHSEWECQHSPTFTVHHRHNRTLRISCPGDFRVEWYFERNGGLTSDVMKNYTNQYTEWSHVTGPVDIHFPTQYADVMCRMKADKGTITHHNYRTQFIPNKDAIAAQKRVFDKLKSEKPAWQPLSVLSINVDSVSRAQFHRSCGLPKTQQLLRRLFNASNKSSHRAYLFNRLNAIGGVTAMNLTPLYSGIFFKKADEEKRVLIHRYTKPIKEWVWDYANQRGFLTSYAMDTGNGLMGTQTICPVNNMCLHHFLTQFPCTISHTMPCGISEINSRM